MNAPIPYQMTEGAALAYLDAAAAGRVRTMLKTMSPREVLTWLLSLNTDCAACKGDVEALLALAGRIERGER